MKSARCHIKKRGFSLVEVLLAAALFSMVVSSLAAAVFYGQDSARVAGERARAVILAEEALEAARNIRDETPDDPFINLADGTYGISSAGSEWSLSGLSDTTDIFERELNISTVDSDTRQLVAVVTWDQTLQRKNAQVALTTYLTNWLSEAPSAIGDWSNPGEESQLDISGGRDGWKVQAVGDYAYIVRRGGNPDFIAVDISDTASPAVADTLALPGGPRNIAVSGNYAYVASSRNNQELQIIDISTPTSLSQAGSYNVPGNKDGHGVYAVGSTVYLVCNRGGGNELHVIDASTPGSPSSLGALNLSSTANEIFVSGDYAYIASDDNGQELQVVDISDPGNLSVDGSYNLPGNDNAETIAGFAGVAVIGRDNGDLYLLDVSVPTSPGLLNAVAYNAGGGINDISLGNSNEYAWLATGNGSEELQVIDIADTSSPAQLGVFDANDNLNGVAYQADKDRALAVGEDNNAELIIFEPLQSP